MEQADDKKKNDHELAFKRTELSQERTELSILRTNLAFQNTKLSIEQTHLAFLRTIVSLVGSAAAIYKALPAIGVSRMFSSGLAVFLLAAAVYFTIKDLRTYPKMKETVQEMEQRKDEMIRENKSVDAATSGIWDVSDDE